MKRILIFVFLIGAIQSVFAKEPPTQTKKKVTPTINFREDCVVGTSSVDLDVNNVRARLQSRGDFWWDYDAARYIVPKVASGSTDEAVSSVFSGAVWLGGFDQSGNLKVATADYANTGDTDFYPGPLDPSTGETDFAICKLWDRHFEVKANSCLFIQNKVRLGQTIEPDEVPDDLKAYPGRGNPFFALQPNGFELPDQDLGSFRDENDDGIFNPIDGDIPVIEIRGCPKENYADQMFFQIYNDNGGPHKNSNGKAFRMEVQVQAFAFATTDELNDMTFMRYKLINRGLDDVVDCYFAMWVDGDLGCHLDDYIGSDTTRSLAYYYGADAIDGLDDCSCPGNAPTYCNRIPLLGVDYFRGPLDEFGDELGMSSFTYANNAGTDPTPPAGTTDPTSAAEYYNLLTAKWRDGTNIFAGGDGYQDLQYPETRYVFAGLPNDPNGWSMQQEGLIPADRRTIQASGPFVLKPSATNELIIGLPWVPDVEHPAPDISALLEADDKAQNLFDACFDLPEGPHAPDVEVIEMDREVVFLLSNSIISNNYEQNYREEDIGYDGDFEFEGYLIYQLENENVSASNYDDPAQSRLVAVSDVKNDIVELYEWNKNTGPIGGEPLWYYETKVVGPNQGIENSFHIQKDLFAEGSDNRLINHRKYYYVVIAYGQNYALFDPNTGSGQTKPYIQGRKSPYGPISLITVIPRPEVFDIVNVGYGESVEITRVSGVGSGGHYLDMVDGEIDKLFDDPNQNKITYKAGAGPFEVKVVNPLKVPNGKFRLSIFDSGMDTIGDLRFTDAGLLDSSLYWVMEIMDDGGNVVNTVTSKPNLFDPYEHVFEGLGISVSLNQPLEAGDESLDNYGAFSIAYEYEDNESPWMITVGDGDVNDRHIVFLDDTINGQALPSFAGAASGPIKFYPYSLTNVESNDAVAGTRYFITPGWANSNSAQVKTNNPLSRLNNVDLVFTSDKSKWSKCMIVETANDRYGRSDASDDVILPIDDTDQFYLRASNSVTKDADPSTGLPVEDPSGGQGMGWFPGYAIDVETGQRLNVFFGENSSYRDEPFWYPDMAFGDEGPRGADMMFNPSSIGFINTGFIDNTNQPLVNSWYLGGQHFVYVTDQAYDGCEEMAGILAKSSKKKRILPLSTIQWTCLPMCLENSQMRSYADGLIPNDLTVKLRATNSFNATELVELDEFEGISLVFGDNPVYEFEIKDLDKVDVTSLSEPSVIDEALDEINVVPNPYYGYSYYETTQYTNYVKITNLPPLCDVTIYSLDGRFIKKFERDVAPTQDSNTKLYRQFAPDIIWDMKNDSGIPISSGVYLIHINAEGMGERTIKWFGVNRQFDPSGL